MTLDRTTYPEPTEPAADPGARPSTEPLATEQLATDQVATEQVAAGTDRRPAGRLLFVDNLRIYLTILVLAHHLAVTYGNIPVWTYLEPPDNPADGVPLDLLVGLNQAYFMGLFFLVSGFFTPRSLDRRGARGFARERLRRLGIPLLGFLVLLRPLFTLGLYLGLPAADRMPYWQFYVESIDPGPLWFVEVLLVFALAYAWLRSRRPAPAQDVDRTAPPLRFWMVLAFAVVLGLALYVWRVLVPVGTYIPVVGLPSAAYLPQYASLFAIGILAYRRDWIARMPGRFAWFAGLLVLVASVALVPFMDLDGAAAGAEAPSRWGFSAAASAMWEAMFAVGAIVVLLLVFRRFLDRQGRLARWASRQAFAVYVIHAVVLVGIGYSLRSVELPQLLKFLLALAIAVPVCWVVAALVRRLPLARSTL